MNEDRRFDVRASDTDRETISRRLAAAAAEGRISAEELEERLPRTREAVAYGDLEYLVRDLPGAEQAHVERFAEPTASTTLYISAALRNARVGGRWEAPPRIVASAGRGSVWIDFTETTVEHDEVVVDARPYWRNIHIIVPEGYSVSTDEGDPGSSDVHNLTVGKAPPGAPHIHVIVRPGGGKVTIRYPRPRRRPPWRWRPQPAH